MGSLGVGATWLFRLLDGWKLVIWSFVMALKQAYPDWPFWGYVDATARAIGWDKLAPAIDPGQLVLFGTLAVAIGHKLIKGYQEYKAGIPLLDVGRSSLDQPRVIVVPTVDVSPEIKAEVVAEVNALAQETKTDAALAQGAADVAAVAKVAVKKAVKGKGTDA